MNENNFKVGNSAGSPRQSGKGAVRLGEVRERSNGNCKIFRLMDGTEQAVFYPNATHGRGENKKADSSLVMEDDGKHFRTNKEAFNARFGNDGEELGLFSINKGHHGIAVSPVGECREKNAGAWPEIHANIPNTLIFADAIPGADLEYSVTADGVKENIVVKEKAEFYQYGFAVHCENVAAVLDQSRKQVSFISKETGSEVFLIPAPFMTDANGIVSMDVAYEVAEVSEDEFLITVSANGDWINAEDRVFPVVIDPQIVVSGSTSINTYSWVDGVMTAPANHTIGRVPVEDDEGNVVDYNVNRMYMHFNMPVLPNNPRIKKAELTFHQQACTEELDMGLRLGLFRVTEDIVVGGTTPTQDTDLIDFESVKQLADGTVAYTFDITRLIDVVCNGETSYQNLVLQLMDEGVSSNSNITLYGSSAGENAPSISITYESSYGVNTSYRTHTHEIGRFGQGSIDLACGNLMFECQDFTWAGIRMPVTIKHLYNSALGGYQYSQNSAIKLETANFSAMNIGLGWKLNIMQSMVVTQCDGDNNPLELLYIGENGDETYFKKEGTQKDINGMEYALFKSETGDEEAYVPTQEMNATENKKYYLLYSDGDILGFAKNGRLLEIADEYSSLNIVYDGGRISCVTDGVDRQFTFIYDINSQLTAITAPDGTSINYTYTDNLLTGVTYPDGSNTVITYNLNRPSAVEVRDAGDNVLYAVQYNFPADRVWCLTEFGAGTASTVGKQSIYEYSAAAHTTHVYSTEQLDENEGETQGNTITTVYTYNDEGEIISEYVYSADVGNTGVTGAGAGIHPYFGDGGVNTVSVSRNRFSQHSFAKTNFWTKLTGGSSGVTVDYVADATQCMHGKRYARIQSTDSAAVGVGLQIRTSVPAGSNTFSAYLRPMSNFDAANGHGAYIRVLDNTGNVLAQSERLTACDSEYVRLAVSFDLEATSSIVVQILLDGNGTVYVNAPQYELNPFASPYNYLENGSFEKPGEYWSTTNGPTWDVDAPFDGNFSMKVTGNMGKCCNTAQTVYVDPKRSVRETFTLSGWAKGCSVPDRVRDIAADENPTFRLRAVVQYNDSAYGDTSTETFTADFSPCTEGWQYASVQFAKSKYRTVESVKVYCDYDYNFGTAYFDDIQFVRDSVEKNLSAADFVEEPEEEVEPASLEEEIVDDDQTDVPTHYERKDAFGNAITETTFTDGEFGTIYRSFNYGTDGNNLIRETDALGNTTTYTVDAETSRNEMVTDRCGNKTLYEYDACGRTTKVTSKNAQDAELANVSYAYDSFDNLTQIVRGDGLKYVLQYNEFHNLQSIGIDRKTEKLVTYGYKSGNGRLKQITYANGDTMKATYNTLGQMVAEKWFNAAGTLTAHYKYNYDNQGNIVRSLDILAGKEYSYYYEEGRIVRAAECDVTITDGNVTGKTLVITIRYHYDNEGNLICKHTLPADALYRQDTYYENREDGNVVLKVKNQEKVYTSHSKNDSFGRKEFDEIQTGFVSIFRRFQYLDGQIPSEYTSEDYGSFGSAKSAPTTNLVSKIVLSDGHTLSYAYDAEERITSVTDSWEGGETVTRYTYDALGQLLTETVDGVVVNTMTYDSYGNILTKNGKVYTYGDVWRDKLTAYDGQAITYDAQGNPVSYLGHTLTWEKGRQLKSFDSNTYTYNANGIRTSKTINGVKHTYTLDGTKILMESWPEVGEDNVEHTRVLKPLYDNEENVCGILYGDIPYYFLKNLQGDIIAITNQNGVTLARYAYDAWGACTIIEDNSNCSIATINPFRYRGYYYDAEIGLYYVSSRYYDAEIGRFLNADDFSKLSVNGVVFDYNTFSYCKNNSVCNKDEYGYFGTPVQWLFAAIGAVAGWFLGDYIAKKLGYYSGWKYWAIRVGVVVGGAVIGWFAAKLLTKILQSFLNANKAIYNKLPRLAKKFLGLKCFVAGTLVSTANGEVKIEEISVGDYVLTYNFDTGNTEYNKVLQVFKNTTDILTCVCFDDEEIVSTPSHRYYVAEKGWIKAKDLQPGDKLILYDNSTKAVKSVYTKRSSIAVPVYNLNVENQHNYFVSKYQVLVHNLGCEDVATNTLKKISKAQIKKLGGEKVTREIKKQFGKSLSNLYVDAKGNVYVSVNGSKIAQWVGDLATLAEMYR